MYTLTSWIQLDQFLRLTYGIVSPQINLMLNENMRDAITNGGFTRPSRSVPPLTNDVCDIPYVMDLS